MCPFGQLPNPCAKEQRRVLAHQLVLGCHSWETLQELFVVGEPDLDHVYNLTEVEERAYADTAAVRGGGSMKLGAALYGIQCTSNGHHSHTEPKHTTLHSKQPSQRDLASTVCSNCGRHGHSASDLSCPARGQQCNNCHKKGHFGWCCRSRPGKGGGGQGQNNVYRKCYISWADKIYGATMREQGK